MSRKKLFQHNYEIVSGDLVRALIERGRQRARKADVALADLATDLRGPFGLRRLRTLWRRDGTPFVSGWEWSELRQRAASWLIRHAEWHEQQAWADRLLARRLIREAANDLASPGDFGAGVAPVAMGRPDAPAEQLAFHFEDDPPLKRAA